MLSVGGGGVEGRATARRPSATTPAARIAARIMNQLSGCRWLVGPSDPTILRRLMPGRICRPASHDPAWAVTGREDVSTFDVWGFHSSCKVDIHLLFFAAPSNSRNIYRSSSKE